MIIVTGGVGFIGSNLIERLEKCFSDIIIVDYLGCGEKWKNIAKRKNVEVINPCNIEAFLRENKRKIKAIVHLGGISSTTEKNVDLIYETNVSLTKFYYNFCVENNIQFIYASSAATYGTGENGFDDQETFDYLERLRPLNAYGWSKNLIDKYILSDKTLMQPHSQVVGLKFFNVYGPNEYHKGEQRSVIEKFYNQLMTSGTVNLFKSTTKDCSNGEQKRDFIYVDDCVNVILWMLEHKDISGLFNVGTGRARTYKSIVEIIANHLNIDYEIHYVDTPQNIATQYQNFTEANLMKLRSAGYSDDFNSLESGIKDYIDKYLSKMDKYK